MNPFVFLLCLVQIIGGCLILFGANYRTMGYILLLVAALNAVDGIGRYIRKD